MVKISDCSCECRDKGKERQIEERALSSINKILGTEGQAYYPDGTGAVTIPIADADQLAQIGVNAEDIATLEKAQEKTATDIAQMKISVDENTTHLTSVDKVLDNHAREIKSNSGKIAGLETVTDALTKELPTDFKLYKPSAGKIQLQCETEDQSLIDSNILDMVIPESFDIISGSTSRSFKLKIQFSDGTTATTNDFVIPEGGGTSVSVTGITLTKGGNTLKTSIVLDDGSTIESGAVQMVSSVAGTFANKQLTITVNGVSSLPIGIGGVGGSYTAGTGIDISSSDVISVDTTVARQAELDTLASKINTTIRTLDFVYYDEEADLFAEVEYWDGHTDSVSIPTATMGFNGLIDSDTYTYLQSIINAGDNGYYTFDQATNEYYPSVDNSTIHYNDNNCLEVIGGRSSNKIFTETDTTYSSAGPLLEFLVALPVGTMITLYLFGKTSSSPCGTLTGVVKSVATMPSKKISITYTGGNFYNGSEIVVVGAMNYNIQPFFNINENDGVELWIPEVKGNTVSGKTYSMSNSFQGYSVAVFN